VDLRTGSAPLTEQQGWLDRWLKRDRPTDNRAVSQPGVSEQRLKLYLLHCTGITDLLTDNIPRNGSVVNVFNTDIVVSRVRQSA